MEDNYLWDRSGEADPAIQELEEILGTLRYQPQPLEIPRTIQLGRRRSFFPAMAIAAAIALCALLLGLWFSFNRRPPAAFVASNSLQIEPPATATQPPLKPGNQAEPAAVDNRPNQTDTRKRREAPRDLLTRNQRRAPRTSIRQPELTPEELSEKEQVLVALRLVSYKLNVAQRKTQGVPQLNTIRNQHKIG